MNDEIIHLIAKVKELQKANQEAKNTIADKKYLCELFLENESQYQEEIALLKNQLHVNGKKLIIPKKPELDWNQKMRLIQDCVPEYLWKDIFEELETLFIGKCEVVWRGIQKVYEGPCQEDIDLLEGSIKLLNEENKVLKTRLNPTINKPLDRKICSSKSGKLIQFPGMKRENSKEKLCQ